MPHVSRLGVSNQKDHAAASAAQKWFWRACGPIAALAGARSAASTPTNRGNQSSETIRAGRRADSSIERERELKFVKYGKYTGEAADAVDLDELVKRWAIFFLQSGFESQFYGIGEFDPERSMEALREAILRALQEGDLLPEDAMSDELREMLQDPNPRSSQEVKDLLEKLIERLGQEGFINPQQPPQVTPPNQQSARGQVGQPHERQPEARFEITDKTIDFLGFKTLQDLLGSLGRSSFGRTAPAIFPPGWNLAALRGPMNLATR